MGLQLMTDVVYHFYEPSCVIYATRHVHMRLSERQRPSCRRKCRERRNNLLFYAYKGLQIESSIFATRCECQFVVRVISWKLTWDKSNKSEWIQVINSIYQLINRLMPFSSLTHPEKKINPTRLSRGCFLDIEENKEREILVRDCTIFSIRIIYILYDLFHTV